MAFSADWLTLREPADHAARSVSLTRRVVDHVTRRAGGEPVRVLDLGCGTGSNLRYLEPHLPSAQQWLLVDHDTALLRAATDRMAEHARTRGLTCEAASAGLVLSGATRDCRVSMQAHDLSSLDDVALFSSRHLVTGAALLDLVSEPWLRQLAARCHDAQATVLFTLTYDGWITCDPPEADDDLVSVLVNEHQHGDKGFGPAEGPDATRVAQACFESRGYQVHTQPSDWVLEPEAAELQRQLIDGWADAAIEMAHDKTGRIHAWRARRLEHVQAGRSHVRVGHQDLAAWLPDA